MASINDITLPRDQNGEPFVAVNRPTMHSAVSITAGTAYPVTITGTYKNCLSIVVYNNTGGAIYHGGSDVKSPSVDATKQGVKVADGSSEIFTATVGFTVWFIADTTGYIVIEYLMAN